MAPSPMAQRWLARVPTPGDASDPLPANIADGMPSVSPRLELSGQGY